MTSFNQAQALETLTSEYNRLLGYAPRLSNATCRTVFLIGLQQVFSYNLQALMSATEGGEEPMLLNPMFFDLAKTPSQMKKLGNALIVHDFLHSFFGIGVTEEDEMTISSIQSCLLSMTSEDVEDLEFLLRDKPSILASLCLGEGEHGFTILTKEITSLVVRSGRG